MSQIDFLVVLAAAIAGGAVQSVLGFGAAYMVVPALAVVAPDLLPAASLFAMAPLVLTMSWRGRRDADPRGVGRLVLGRIPGVAVGTGLVVLLDRRGITIVVAVILLVAVASMARGWTVPITPTTQAVSGFASGVTGTSTGLGGPPLALLYRQEAGAGMRATLAWTFVAGVSLSLTSLTLAGETSLRHARIGVVLGLGAVAGLVLARPLVARASTEQLRTGVLGWAAAGAVVALVRAVLT